MSKNIESHQTEDRVFRPSRDFAKKARVKGFRKGKVPKDVVLRMYADGIRESVLQDIVNESWKIAIEQEDLKPIADPRIKDLKFENDEPLTVQSIVLETAHGVSKHGMDCAANLPPEITLQQPLPSDVTI